MIEGRWHEEKPLKRQVFCFHVYLVCSVCLHPTGVIYSSGLNIHESLQSRCLVIPALIMAAPKRLHRKSETLIGEHFFFNCLISFQDIQWISAKLSYWPEHLFSFKDCFQHLISGLSTFKYSLKFKIYQ